MIMQATAIDRALLRVEGDPPPPTDWNAVRRIIRRQNAPHTLQMSLERIAEEPGLPLGVLRFAVGRVGETSAGGDSVQQVFNRCIRNIWRRVLVDRLATAFHAFQTVDGGGNTNEGVQLARIEYEQELLSIQSRSDLRTKPLFYDALEKTKFLIQSLQELSTHQPPPYGYGEQTYVHAVARYNLAPFLVLLAFRDDPDCLLYPQTRYGRGLLPLHIAAQAEHACRIYDGGYDTTNSRANAHPRHGDPQKIRFSSSHREGNPHDAVSQQLLYLLNRDSVVPILCHLCPRAGAVASNTMTTDDDLDEAIPLVAINDQGHIVGPTRGYTPLEHFLYSLRNTMRRNQDDTPLLFIEQFTWSPSNVQRILQTVRQMIRVAPLALETRHPQTRLWPFLVPMTYWDSYQLPPSRTRLASRGDNNNNNNNGKEQERTSASSGQLFLLTLSYEMLRANPIVLSRCYNAHQVQIRPCTQYEGVLKERIAKEECHFTILQHTRDELKRRVAQLEHENEQLAELQRQKKTKKKKNRISSFSRKRTNITGTKEDEHVPSKAR